MKMSETMAPINLAEISKKFFEKNFKKLETPLDMDGVLWYNILNWREASRPHLQNLNSTFINIVKKSSDNDIVWEMVNVVYELDLREDLLDV